MATGQFWPMKSITRISFVDNTFLGVATKICHRRCRFDRVKSKVTKSRNLQERCHRGSKKKIDEIWDEILSVIKPFWEANWSSFQWTKVFILNLKLINHFDPNSLIRSLKIFKKSLAKVRLNYYRSENFSREQNPIFFRKKFKFSRPRLKYRESFGTDESDYHSGRCKCRCIIRISK